MRKKLIITLMILLLNVSLARNVFSYRSEKDGYNGFKWGTDLETFLKTSKSTFRKVGSVYYGDRIKGVDVDIGYQFHNNALYGVMINFPPEKRDEIIKYFTIVHGEPSLVRGKTLYWIGVSTKIVIKKKDVEIVSKDLERKYLLERKRNKRKSKSKRAK